MTSTTAEVGEEDRIVGDARVLDAFDGPGSRYVVHAGRAISYVSERFIGRNAFVPYEPRMRDWEIGRYRRPKRKKT